MDKTNAPDELLDLVNEQDEVIGEVRKGEANANPNLIHREVRILIFNAENKVLFQKRSSKKIVAPGIWSSGAAGHVPQGLDTAEAAHKELQEELGFDMPLQFVGKELSSARTETRIDNLFIGKYKGQKITVNTDEVEKVSFFSQDEVLTMQKMGVLFSPHAVDKAEKFWNGDYERFVKNL